MIQNIICMCSPVVLVIKNSALIFVHLAESMLPTKKCFLLDGRLFIHVWNEQNLYPFATAKKHVGTLSRARTHMLYF